MTIDPSRRRRLAFLLPSICLLLLAGVSTQDGGLLVQTRDPLQKQDETFAKAYGEWTGDAKYGSPLVDHLPLVPGIPTPKELVGHHIGAPRALTYYADILRHYRALAEATPRVRVETVGRSEEGRELVVVWVSSEQNMAGLQANRDRLARLADPRGLPEDEARRLIASTKPSYHLIGGLHSSETGPSEMLMELAYRLATETSPIISRVREQVYVSITPVADPDGRDRYVDWFYRGLEDAGESSGPPSPAAQPAAPAGGDEQRPRGGPMAVPYWGRYVFHDNNRDINLATVESRALAEWFFTAHPPVMHDLHESQPLMFTYSGGPPQNPNLDPLVFAELPWFSSWELAQMTKWGMPGVYTHAFMDGWSPGYYASVAFNHNAVMRMYETQSGRDPGIAARSADRAGLPAAAPTPPTTAPTMPPATAPTTTAATTATAEGRRSGGPAAPAARASALPSGRGGTQDREWYRGLPVPPNATASFSRRDNTNYMETGVLSALELTAQFPTTVVENFYVKARNAIEDGRTRAPYGFVIPAQRDMTRVAELLRTLLRQHIEIGRAASAFKLGDVEFPAGSYVIKRDQPYGRLAKNLLEKQVYPDTRLTTYDDSGWTMGLLMAVDVKEIGDAAVLKVATTPVTAVSEPGKVAGKGEAGLAVAHYGSINMIALRYRLAGTSFRIAERAFESGGVPFPAGSFVMPGPAAPAARAAIEELGLTAAALDTLPQVPMHEAPAPRLAIYSQWTGTQDLGWYRLAFDRLGIPYDLIYKEQVRAGGLRARYDVIIVAAQNLNRQAVLQAPSSRAQPYQKSQKYKFLGMYGETPDMSGGLGQEGVDAVAAFLEGGGTLVAAAAAARFPIEFGWAHTVDIEPITGVTAQRPIVEAEIVRPEHPVFYGYAARTMAIKYAGGFTLRVGVADQPQVLARYAGGDASVLSGAMVGADQLRQKAFAVDIPRACNGNGRVLIFANNPVYRWQNQGEFNVIFNALLNWRYVPPAGR